ncbi:MAG: PIN domain nuclease, partial [Bacillus sp. (in: firmicutes)]
MLKRIVQACFLIMGGTLGILLLPELFILLHINDIPLINNSYITAVLGAIIFYLITFWAVDYVFNFIKWAEDSLVKVPVTDVLFGSVGLIFGLLVAFLIGFALNAVQVPILNAVAPIILTILFGYLGFQVGFKKR